MGGGTSREDERQSQGDTSASQGMSSLTASFQSDVCVLASHHSTGMMKSTAESNQWGELKSIVASPIASEHLVRQRNIAQSMESQRCSTHGS